MWGDLFALSHAVAGESTRQVQTGWIARRQDSCVGGLLRCCESAAPDLDSLTARYSTRRRFEKSPFGSSGTLKDAWEQQDRHYFLRHLSYLPFKRRTLRTSQTRSPVLALTCHAGHLFATVTSERLRFAAASGHARK